MKDRIEIYFINSRRLAGVRLPSPARRPADVAPGNSAGMERGGGNGQEEKEGGSSQMRGGDEQKGGGEIC
jgi:hypothetical protein